MIKNRPEYSLNNGCPDRKSGCRVKLARQLVKLSYSVREGIVDIDFHSSFRDPNQP